MSTPRAPTRHAQTDLTGALRYGYIHDVHDADAAYHQRYAGDAGEESSHQVGGGVQHRAELLLAAYGEIIVVRCPSVYGSGAEFR